MNCVGSYAPTSLASLISEDNLRDVITSLVQEKYSPFHNLDDISSMGFEFVKVVNKRVRKPDGHPVCNGRGIKDIYGKGSIYVRLIKCVSEVRTHSIQTSIVYLVVVGAISSIT